MLPKNMHKESKKRIGTYHLYNPENEGLGSYDVNYINAYKRVKNNKNNLSNKLTKRHAA